MSTFCGQFNEIPGISIDRFDGQNLESEIFFLSHCHTDHMIGLANPDGLPGPLYLSHISSVIIKRQYPKLSKNLIEMKICEPTLICYRQKDETNVRLTVTTVPAGHCPGSVMFLIEMNNLKMLYTGDFRIRLKDLKNMTTFLDHSNQQPIKLNKIYFDSTFFSKIYPNFPTQSQSISVICDLIDEWLKLNDKNKISLRTCARYGYEFLFKSIYDRFNEKIHINQLEYEKYQYIPELDNCFTNNSSASRIHACFLHSTKKFGGKCKSDRYLMCDETYKSEFIRIIQPSAMIWTDWQIGDDIFNKVIDFNEYFRVCYSNHSSYQEILDLLKYFQAEKIECNVLPAEGTRKRIEMLYELENLTTHTEPTTIVIENNEIIHKKFNRIKFKTKNKNKKILLEQLLAEDCEMINVNQLNDNNNDLLINVKRKKTL